MSVDLSDGGVLLVVGGYNKSWREYRDNPQIEFWSGDDPSEVARKIRDKDIPSNCKGVAISRFISHSELGHILSEVRRRQISMYPNLSDGEISRLLDEAVSSQPKSVKTRQEKIEEPIKFEDHAKINLSGDKGKLKKLDHLINLNETNVANANRILPLAAEMGVQTTSLSLQNYVGQFRKKQKGTGFPASVKRNKLDLTVEMLDGLISDLQGMRDFLIEITEENKELKAKMEGIRAALNVLNQ